MDEAEGEESCPLCLELLDVTDRSLQPCKCHYRVCLWCLNHIRERLNGLCPACRTPYEEVNFTVSEVSKETAVREAKERANAKKERERREKQKEREKELARAAQVSQQKALTNLKHARFVVRNLVYVIGLSMSYAREDYIRRSEMFGRFGRIIRVLVNRAHPYNSDAPGGPSISAYIQFARDIDASAAVRQMSNVVLDGREIRCHIACTKYCDAFVRSGLHCGNADCMYVHEQATNPEEVLSREDVLSRQLGPPPPAHLFLPVRRRIDMNTPSSRAAAAAAAAATAQAAANAQAAAAAAAASAAAASGNYSTAPPALSSNPTLTSASAPTLPMQRQYPAAPPNGSGTSAHRSQGSSVSVAPSASVPGSQSHQHRFPPFISQTPASSASSSASGVGRQAQRSPPLSPRFGTATTQAGLGQSRGAQPVSQVPSSVGWGASPPLSTTPQRSPSQSPPQRSGRRGQAPPSPPGEDLKRTRKRPAGPAAPSGAAGARPGVSRTIGGSIGRSTSQSALSSTSTGSQPSVPPGGAPPGFEDVPAPATALSRPPPGFGAPRSVSNAPPMPSSSSGPAIGRSGRGPPGFDVSSSVAPPTVPPVTGPPPSSGSFDWPWSHDPARSGGAGGRVTAQSRGGPAGAPVGGTGDRLPDRPQAQEPSTFRGGHGSIERAEAAFSGRGIVLPAMSIPTSFSGVRSSGGTGPAALPHEALSVANGVHSLPHGQGGAGGVAEMLTQRGFGMDAPGAHAAFVAPELRPSRRSNSRFGFAREEEQPVPPASSLGSAATSSVSSSSAGTSSRHVPPDPPSVLSGTSSSKTAKSRFDFAEHELSPPRTSAPPGLAPAAPPQIFPFAADVGGMSSPADGVAVSFSQLSTQDKLASLFQSAKWSSEALPPMPSAGDGLDRSQNHGTSPFSQQHQGGPRDRVANNSLPAAATAAKPSNSPLVPPGFREATSEQPQQVDRAPTSVSPGVAASLKDEEGRKVEAAMTVRLKGSSPGSSEVGTARRGHSASESDISSRPASTSDSLSSAKDEGCKVSTVSTREGESVGSTGGMPQTHSTSGADIVADANAVDLVSEFELERQVEAARAREARLAAQLSDLQQRIRHFDART